MIALLELETFQLRSIETFRRLFGSESVPDPLEPALDHDGERYRADIQNPNFSVSRQWLIFSWSDHFRQLAGKSYSSRS